MPPARPADMYLLSVVALLALLERLSSSRLNRLCAGLAGDLAWKTSRRKRRRIEAALAGSLDSLPSRQRRDITQGSCRSFWEEVLSLVPSGEERSRLKRIPVEGLEHLEASLGKGRGVVLWESAYFGSRTLAKQVLHSLGFRLYQLHGEAHLAGLSGGRESSLLQRQIVKPFLEKLEQRHLSGIVDIPQTGSLVFGRRILELLESNNILCSAADGDQGTASRPIEFLGRRVSFFTGVPNLARTSGASLLPLFGMRWEDGSPLVRIGEPLQGGSESDREEYLATVIRRFAGELEELVRRHPEQYRGWDQLPLVGARK